MTSFVAVTRDLVRVFLAFIGVALLFVVFVAALLGFVLFSAAILGSMFLVGVIVILEIVDPGAGMALLGSFPEGIWVFIVLLASFGLVLAILPSEPV